MDEIIIPHAGRWAQNLAPEAVNRLLVDLLGPAPASAAREGGRG